MPERFKGPLLYRHNAIVALMRTTADENCAIGAFIAAKLNAMREPLRFLVPEGDVSAIDKPGQPFHDPAADDPRAARLNRQRQRRHRSPALPDRHFPIVLA